MMDPKDFVHLHVHSHFSLLEALPSPKKLVSRIADQGMNALALTDNGALYGAVEFFEAAKKADITPIIGLDVYIAQHRMTDKRPRVDDRPYRLTLISINDAGYKNLLKISTDGFLEGFYYKPRVDKEYLADGRTEGLIALSGGLKGEIPQALVNDDKEKAIKLVHEYQELFGRENFYLELVHHPDFGRQVDANDAVIALAKELDVPLVATKNASYLDPDDRDGFEAQLCIMRGRTLEEFRQTNVNDVDLSLGTADEIIEYFKDVPEACENTRKIADRVNFEMDLGNNYLPIFPMPEGMNDEDYLHELSLKGLKERYGEELSPKVMERFEFEYETIKRMGFCSYFIIVQDFVNFAKDRGILVGPGRGSAAGSIISYALKITDLDPLHYGLLFERFLNPDRISMPDVDMDFADNRRGEVLRYVSEKYGEDKVAGIITFGTLKPKAAVRDAARVLGLSFQEADVIAKAVPDPVQGRHMPLAVAIEDYADLRELYRSNDMARRVVELARKMEGNPRHTSQHACGFVIGDVPLVERVPVQRGQREDTAFISQYSLNSAEAAGLVKMDFLGLSNLTIIQDALDIIKAVYGDEVDSEAVPLDDQKTFDLLGRGETTGVFQLESDGMKRYIRELKPTEFEDIVAMVALYRPGPLSAGMVPQYIDRKNGREKVKYDHPLMEDILKETYGVTVYQEQIMKISVALAGFTGGEADTLRKAMGKKKRDVLAKMYEGFVSGCVKNGVPQKTAKKIWVDWEGFADYAFNKSHAACYGMISYRTAYLKAHYPSAFMAAVMNSDSNNIDRITIEVEECERMGMHVLPPDVNESFPGFAVVKETGNIRWGLAAVKNLGEEAAKAIVAERKENGVFEDLADFASRIDSKYFNKKTLDALIKSGALDSFDRRSQLLGNMDQLLQYNRQLRKDQEQNQVSMFDFAPDITEEKLSLRTAEDISTSQILSWERELLGIYVSQHPASLFTPEMEKASTPAGELSSLMEGSVTMVMGVVAEVKRIVTKKSQKPMAFVRLEDTTGSTEVVVFPRTYIQYREILEEGSYFIIQGKVSVRERGDGIEHSILADKILRFTDKDIPSLSAQLSQGSLPDSFDEDDFEEEVEEGVAIIIDGKPDHVMIGQLREIFTAAPGNERVFLHVKSGEHLRKVATEYSISRSPKIIQQIATVVGAENVK
jgi:DNA polymerase III subunit alpha